MPPPTHPCAACGARVFTERPGSLATCPVCAWVDDLEQLAHPDLVVGANTGRSLREAQADALATVAQRGDFPRDPAWRPLRPGEEPDAAAGEFSSPACALTTPPRDGFVPYWRR